MKQIICYLTFDGNCREAMNFYRSALGGELQMMTYADMPQSQLEASERILHAHLSQGEAILMASDTMPGTPFNEGNNFSVSVACESVAEEERFFAALSAGGSVIMPLQDTFWGAHFGMLKDKFGVQWMFNHDNSPSAS